MKAGDVFPRSYQLLKQLRIVDIADGWYTVELSQDVFVIEISMYHIDLQRFTCSPQESSSNEDQDISG